MRRYTHQIGLKLMEDQVVKIQRSSNLIKGFMALVVLMQVFQIYQTNVMDWGSLAGAFGVLSLLRGLLLSPVLLAAPIKYWFKSNFTVSKVSYKYFLLAFILIVVSAF
jgi:membrane protein CcdC involved in cytochrome C biogenesis